IASAHEDRTLQSAERINRHEATLTRETRPSHILRLNAAILRTVSSDSPLTSDCPLTQQARFEHEPLRIQCDRGFDPLSSPSTLKLHEGGSFDERTNARSRAAFRPVTERHFLPIQRRRDR